LVNYNFCVSHIGKYRLLELRNTHREFNKENRPNLFYSIYVDPSSFRVSLTQNEIYTKKVDPLWNDGFEGCWTWGKELFKKDNHLLIGQEKKGEWKIYRKSYSHTEEGHVVKKKLFTIWNDSSFFTERGQAMLGDIFPGFNKNDFPQPKAVEYIKQILEMSKNIWFYLGYGKEMFLERDSNPGDNPKHFFFFPNTKIFCFF
jgi:adenine-specific DNA-methyltransferase